MTFKARDAQLAASFSFKSRSALTIEKVINEDCPEPPNSESIHQPTLVDLKKGKSVSTPPNPPSPQDNSIPLHTTPLEQPPQPGDDTAQPQNDATPLPTPSLMFPKPNIIPMPTKDDQNPPPPELFNSLIIRIISAAPFAQIIQEDAQAYQLHVSPSLPKEHLQANANVATPETKLEEQILHEVVPPEYHEYANVFSKGSTKELPPHHSYNHKINASNYAIARIILQMNLNSKDL
ncbi:hypothetical protein C0995_004589 [Termitomyces sp. Mi166|nr:hypothetical protein C0995_004589 [Termitomyces sp. Mi166\